MLHPGCLPLFAVLGNDLLVDCDLGADDLGLLVIQTKFGVEEGIVVEGLSINVKDELSPG